MSNKKVYCKNCKWLDHIGYCEVQNSKIFSVYSYTYKTGSKQRSSFQNGELYKKHFKVSYMPSTGNRDCKANVSGECPFYKRKWYKPWARRKSPNNLEVILKGGVQ